MSDSRILLGVIGRAHGVRGLLRVTSHTADPTDLTSYGPLFDDRGRRFVLTWRGEGVAEVAELAGDARRRVADRTAAEKLTNTRLYVDRAVLPAAAEDEFYLADLIGAAAVCADGAPLGRVAAVHDYGAGASIEIERPDAPALIVPFTRACVPEVDVAAARVTVVPPLETTAPGADPARQDVAGGADRAGGAAPSDTAPLTAPGKHAGPAAAFVEVGSSLSEEPADGSDTARPTASQMRADAPDATGSPASGPCAVQFALSEQERAA